MYERLHHVSVPVTDLKRAKRFYEAVLGLEESDERPDFPFEGAWYRIGADQLHLIVHPGAETKRSSTTIDTMDGHFALRVRDMRKVLQRLDEHGWKYESRPHSMTGWHQVFVTDPDGNVIEINAEQSGQAEAGSS